MGPDDLPDLSISFRQELDKSAQGKKLTRLELDKSMAREKMTGQVNWTNSTRPGELTQGNVNEQGLDKSSALGRLSASSTRPGENYSGQGNMARTGQIARCLERGLEKNWTSRAEQPGVGRTLDKPSGPPLSRSLCNWSP
eukprot:gene15172-biopygen15712